MYSTNSDLDMIECPYDKSHRMLRKRLQFHLIKCRQHYPDVELQKCPFNQTHLIPEPEFVFHVTNCSDRTLITQYKYNAPDVKEKELEKVKQEPIECDENWDDTDVIDYDPGKHITKARVLRQPVGSNPSERKEFMKKERKRLGDSDSEDDEKPDMKHIKVEKTIDHESSDGSLPPTPPPPSIDNWHSEINKLSSKHIEDRALSSRHSSEFSSRQISRDDKRYNPYQRDK